MAIRVDGWLYRSEVVECLRQIHLSLHNRYLIKFNSEKFLSANVTDHFGRTPLILAILTRAGLRELKVLLKCGADVDGLWITKYPYGKLSPLAVAVRFKDLELVEFLLENGAHPNLTLFEGNTVLHLAVSCDDLPIVDSLLKHKADPQIKNAYGYTPLHLAAAVSTPLLKKLMTSCDSLVHCGPSGETPLHIAAYANNIESVKLLVSKLKFVNFEMQDRVTPCDCAPVHSKVRQLLSDLDKSSGRKKSDWAPFSEYFPEPLTKLMEAIRPILLHELLNENGIVKEFLAHKKPSLAEERIVHTSEFCPPITLPPEWYWIPHSSDFPNPCIMRITSGFSLPTSSEEYTHATYDTVYERLKNGDIMSKDDYFTSFMAVVKRWGAFTNSYEALALGALCLKMLKDEGVNVNGTDETGHVTLLYVALDEGYENLAIWLMTNGADTKKVTLKKTPLMMASARGMKDAVDLIISSGADVNVVDCHGATALHIASYYALFTPPEIIKSLVAAGADVNKRGPHDLTPLHLAAISMSSNRCDLLLDSGAYIDLKALSLKPVDMAFLFMNIPAAATLKLAGDMFKSAIKRDIKNMEKHLMRGANVNCQRSDYGTPLIALSHINYTLHTILLLKYDPDYKIADKYGKTAIHWAVRRKNHCTLTMYLKKWGIDMLFELGNVHHIDNLVRIARQSSETDSAMPGETEYVLNSWKSCYERFGREKLESLINKHFYDYVGFATVVLKHGWNNAKAYFEGRVCEKEKPKTLNK